MAGPGLPGMVMCPRCGSNELRVLCCDTREAETGYRDQQERGRCRTCGYEGDVEEFDVLVMVDGAEINYAGLPRFCRDNAADYFERRMMPGSGWLAILECSLYAVTRVDDETRAALPQIVRWLHNYAPANAWGSRGAVREWLAGERNANVHPVLRPIVNRAVSFVSPEFEHLNAAAKEGL